MKRYLLIFSLIILQLGSCLKTNGQKEISLIKSDLSNRYVNYEVIQINPDSANVYGAINTLRAIQIRIPENNFKVLQVFQKIIDGYDQHKGYDEIINLRKELYDFMLKFEASRFSKPDPCFYVKYLYYKEGLKIPIEEYYHLRLMGNGTYDIIHRPFDWDEFLKSKNYDRLIEESKKYSEEIKGLEI